MSKLLTISLGEINGKMSKLLTISLGEINGKMSKLLMKTITNLEISADDVSNPCSILVIYCVCTHFANNLSKIER